MRDASRLLCNPPRLLPGCQAISGLTLFAATLTVSLLKAGLDSNQQGTNALYFCAQTSKQLLFKFHAWPNHASALRYLLFYCCRVYHFATCPFPTGAQTLPNFFGLFPVGKVKEPRRYLFALLLPCSPTALSRLAGWVWVWLLCRAKI